MSTRAQTSQVSLPVRFKTDMRNTVWDVLRDRSWKEIDSGDIDWDFYWAPVTWIHEQYGTLAIKDEMEI